MFSTIVQIGNNGNIIIEFAVGLFAFYLVIAILMMGIEAIRRFLEIS